MDAFYFIFLMLFKPEAGQLCPGGRAGLGAAVPAHPRAAPGPRWPQHCPEPPSLAGQDDPWWIASAGNTAPRKHPSSHRCQGTMAITPLRTSVWVARPSQPHTMPRSPPRCRGGGGTLLMVLRAPCCTHGSFYGKASPRW